MDNKLDIFNAIPDNLKLEIYKTIGTVLKCGDNTCSELTDEQRSLVNYILVKAVNESFPVNI